MTDTPDPPEPPAPTDEPAPATPEAAAEPPRPEAEPPADAVTPQAEPPAEAVKPQPEPPAEPVKPEPEPPAEPAPAEPAPAPPPRARSEPSVYDDMARPKPPSRSLAITLAVIAAGCLVFAAFTRAWLVNNDQYDQLGFGLRSGYECATGHDVCEWDRSNSAIVDALNADAVRDSDHSSNVFPPMGWATLVTSLLAAAGLLGAAAIAASRKRPELVMTPSTIALLGIMIALITGCVFVATKPGPAGWVGVGISFWVFGGGCVMGIAGAQLLAKINRPPDPDLMEGAIDPDQF